MLRHTYIIFFFLSLLLLSSCEKEQRSSLTISADTLLVANTEGIASLEIEASGNWTATVASTWCTISPASGEGNATMSVTATDNLGEKERSVFVYVTSGAIKERFLVKQDKPSLNIDITEILAAKESAVKELKIVSNTRWNIEIPADVSWLSVEPSEGEGNMTVTLTIDSNDGGVRESVLAIKYANFIQEFTVMQERGKNVPPDVVLLKSPFNNKTNANRLSTFRWYPAEDPDGDRVSYILNYGKSSINWDYSLSLEDTVYNLPEYLDANTTYYWSVSAKDEYGEESVSETSSFTTGEETGYFDGEYRIAQDFTKGEAPSRIIFTGDGYQSEDYEEGGKFDNDIDQGIEAFFGVEPYSTYRDYFTVYKLAAYSRDEGVSQPDKEVSKNTKFSTAFLGGSSLGVETNDVFEFVKKIPGINDESLKNTLIVVVLNQDRYAGTCWMWSDGRAIALVPVSKSTSPGSHYSNLMNHEAGGHGFGRLADEYVTSANTGKTITESESEKFESFASRGFYANVSLTDDRSEIKWKHFFPVEDYERVGVYEGAFYFSYGAWRSETSSCMVQNEKYYNAPSREAMVKRIFETAGMQYTLNAFIEKDVQKAPSPTVATYSKRINPLTFVPLAPPVMVE